MTVSYITITSKLTCGLPVSNVAVSRFSLPRGFGMIFSLGLRSCPANKLGASKAPFVEALRVLPPVERGKLGIGVSKSLEGRAGHSGLLPPMLFYHMLDSRSIPLPDA